MHPRVILIVMVCAGGVAGAAVLADVSSRPASGNADVQQREIGAAVQKTYDEFMQLGPTERRDRFSEASAEQKADIVRVHAILWLRDNNRRLTAGERAVFDEAIGVITPDVYRGDVQAMTKSDAVKKTFRCRVNADDVYQAFNVFQERQPRPEGRRRWSHLDRAQCWLEWLAEGVVDYIPIGR